MGEELETLSMKDLQNLEHQIDVSLKHIRTRKVHFFMQQGILENSIN